MTQSTASELSVAAIVVYFRTPVRLQECLRALRDQSHPVGEIVVVDNSSIIDGDQEPPALGTDWHWVPMRSNVGFAAACNEGARRTSAAYLLFVNPDVRLEPYACEALVSIAEGDRRRAVCGPRIYDVDGNVELSARSFPTLKTGVLGRASVATRLLRRAGATPRSIAMALDEVPRRVEWVSGACMLVRRSAFDDVGGFDAGYWMYWEDADLCRRLAAANRQTWFVPSAVARHATGSSGKSAASVRAFHESAARYYETHIAHSRISAALARAVLRARGAWALAAARRAASGPVRS
jgi:GT2 family glycosyltransferase